jgi:hypothetical protein
MNCYENGPSQPEPMMSPMDFSDMGRGMTALIHSVMRVNLRAMQELSRVENPQSLMELQWQFAREYVAALQEGVMTLISSLGSSGCASGDALHSAKVVQFHARRQ